MVAMASAYDWQRDKHLLVLRDVLNLRRRVKKSFIHSISAVSSCLTYYANLRPTSLSDGTRVLFCMPEYVYVADVAEKCKVSRHTVYRVLDYLAAIGDVVTHTKYDAEAKTYSPTQIILTESFFIRIGFSYEELKKAIFSVNKDKGLDDTKQIKKSINHRIDTELRKSVKSRLVRSSEKLLSNVTLDENVNVERSKSIQLPGNSLIRSLVGLATVNRGSSVNDYAPSSSSERIPSRSENYLSNPEYKAEIIRLQKDGVPISQRHSKAIKNLNLKP
jgi:hypothetical protein